MKITPIDFIKLIRESDRYIQAIYTQGGCYQFHLILKRLFSPVECLINVEKDHVVTKIGGKLYDINGIVTGEYYPLTKEDLIKVKNWSFSKNMLISITDCPFCEEPICV